MNQPFSKLITINRFLKTFKISRKLLFFIGALIVITAIGQAFTAGLLIPFMNSLRNVDTVAVAGADTNRVIEFMNGLYSGIAPEQRFIYILLSIIGITAGVQVLTIYTEMLILKFAMFKIQDNVSNILFNEILNARLKFFYTRI